MDKEIIHIDCDCMDASHSMRFWYDSEFNQIYTTIHLQPLAPWYKRVWIAIKFIFGKSGNKWDGEFDNWVINRHQIIKLRDYLNELINSID